MQLKPVALTMFIVVLSFYLLNLGQSILLPLVIAGAIAFLINALAHAIGSLRLRGIRLPKFLTFVLAVILILASLSWVIQLITDNVAHVIKQAPAYQTNLEIRINTIYAMLSLEQSPSVHEILKNANLSGLLQGFAKTVSGLAGSMGIIFVYLIFIILEQRTFESKIRALVPQTDQQTAVFSLLQRINRDIRTYVGIKVLTSATTGLLSYLVLEWVGVDSASFWAVLIFLLNFIPTIGSIIATAFPALLTLVQFENWTPFFVVAIVITAIQFFIGSIVEPRLMGSKLNLSPLVLLLSLALWGSIWGIPGMFLCVPITVMIVIICSYFPQTRPLAVMLSGDGSLSAGSDAEVTGD
ncbi:MAG: AI-2E family transporter [Verrucomicrobia bacterium]|nr:AI-2E family transporter [Verrucomicrobiota bacterium]